MISRTTNTFWKLHDALPPPVKLQAKVVYLRWKTDPFHTSLDFKRISRKLPVYSIRIGRSWRALGKRENNTVTWFWIGSHEAYNEFIKRL
jgi:hypothetical protein